MKKLKPFKWQIQVKVSFLTFLICIFLFFQSFAQDEVKKTPTLNFNPSKNRAEKSRKDQSRYSLPQISQIEKIMALEGALDEDEYYVGPGDLFMINLLGVVDEVFTTAISPEGTLLIPGLPVIEVKDLSLREFKNKVTKEINQTFRNIDVTISLYQVRQFKVSVTGAVNFPGSYIVSAIDRVSDALEYAGGTWTEEIDPTLKKDNQLSGEEEYVFDTLMIPSKRNIKVFRDDSLIIADLLSFEQSGIKKSNPHLKDGDVIFVPNVPKDYGYISIHGAVNLPGDYEYCSGDRIMDLINLGQGLRLDAQKDYAKLVRKIDGKNIHQKIDLSKILEDQNCDENIELKQNDYIYIYRDTAYVSNKLVEVRGEVNFPGSYLIEEGETKLSEIIELAGGFTEHASLDRSLVLADPKNRNKRPDDELERLINIQARDLDDIEYAYLKAGIRHRQDIVSVDFKELFVNQNQKEDIALYHGDIIEVKRKEHRVNVLGAVNIPGFVDFVPGKKLKYYVKQTQGLTSLARKGKIRIIKAGRSEQIPANMDTLIAPGDTIFIPEKPYHDFWEIFKETVMVVSQLVTIVLVIQNMK